jgi:hypothetical protein
MNPLKHKMANEWMRQDDATPQEALDTWNAMEAEFKANRAMTQEPRFMAQGGRIGFKNGFQVKDSSPNYFKAADLARDSGELKMIRATDTQFKDWVSKNISSQSDLNKKHKKLKNKEKIFEAKQGQIYLDDIKSATAPLTLGEKQILYKSYDPLFKEEYKRLLALGDPFSKTDLNRAVINRIASENPTIDLQKGIGLDKIPGGGSEEAKTLFERYDKTSARGSLFNKKELANFTQGNQVFARANTKAQENIFNAILGGNSDKSSLAKKLRISEGRLDYNIEKLMRTLSKESDDQYIFLKDFKEKDLEKVRNSIYESPSLEGSYQRTITQSILQSTKLGSPERKKAFQKLKEFNKFKQVMVENGLDPKLLAMDHAASYRAIKNGNIKSFLSVTPVMKDINTLKSSFDRRSQLNLRRMRDYLLAGDTENYKYFLKNQTELENLWKTMTGGQSSLGKIRVTATGPHKGKIRIYDYGSTSLLDKNKNLLDELADNLSIRKNIVNASSTKNLDEARRIMLEGSELTEKKMLGTLKKTDRAPKTVIDKSFQALDKPEMFKAEKKIGKLLSNFWCGKKQSAAGGGRIGFSGSCPVEVKRRNFIAFNNDVRTGKITGEAAEQIAKNTAKVVTKAGGKSALASLLGPYGIGLDVVYEVGSVGIDMYAGKPWKEAVQDNWVLGTLMPGTGQEEFHKRLFEEYPVGYEGERTKKYPEAKPYGSGLDLKQAYIKKQKQIERIKADTTYRGKAEAERWLPKLERDLKGIEAQYNALTKQGKIMEEGSNEYENYMAAVTEARDADKATSPATKAKLKMELDRPISDRALSYKQGEPVKIDFKLPGNYTTAETIIPSTEEVNEVFTKEGFNLSPEDIAYVKTMEKWRQLFTDPKAAGIKGSQDWRGATGGIASLKKKW